MASANRFVFARIVARVAHTDNSFLRASVFPARFTMLLMAARNLKRVSIDAISGFSEFLVFYEHCVACGCHYRLR